MALPLDSRLIQPNGEPEIIEDFNRIINIIESSSGSGSGSSEPDYAADVDAFYENLSDEYKSAFFNEDDERIYLKDMITDEFITDGQWTDEAHEAFAKAMYEMYCAWSDTFGEDGPGTDDKFSIPYDESHIVNIIYTTLEEEDVENDIPLFFEFCGNIQDTMVFVGYPYSGLLATLDNGSPLNKISFNNLAGMVLDAIYSNEGLQATLADLISTVIPNADEMTF